MWKVNKIGIDQIWYSADEYNKLVDALKKIQDCATTEMVEISTRTDYNGLIALKGISAKVTQVLKEVEGEIDE